MRSQIAVIIGLTLPTVALAAPEHVRLSWCGQDAGTSVCITWNDPGNGGNQVNYGFAPTLSKTVQATSFSAPAVLGTIYEAELTGLSPNSTYDYRVGGGGAAWSQNYTFQTGPKEADACVPFTFIALGDNRSQDDTGADPKWTSILNEAVEGQPAFVLNTGDLVRDGKVVQQWKDFLDKTDPAQAYVPLMPSMGNHDDDKVVGEGALYNMVFQLPRNSATDTEDFYYFTYGDAIFVSISSTTFKDDNFTEQANWLDKILTENPRRWKFAYFHHPPYTSYFEFFGSDITHPPNEAGQNAALIPVFDKHGMDIVFNGHNHYYERLGPFKGGGGSDQGVGASDGTHYVITGGAGAFTVDFELGIPVIDLVCGNASGSKKCDGRHHYIKTTIDGNDLTMEVWATAAQNFDQSNANIALVDTLTVTKKDALDCAGTAGGTVGDTTTTGDDTTGEATTGGETTGSATTGEPGTSSGGSSAGGEATSATEDGATGDDEGATTDGGSDGDETGGGDDTTGEATSTGGLDSAATTGGPIVTPGAGGGSTTGEGEAVSDEGERPSGCQAGASGNGGPGWVLMLMLCVVALRVRQQGC